MRALACCLWVLVLLTLASWSEEILEVADPRMRSALTWVEKGWTEHNTLRFSNRLCETRGLSKEMRETLKVLVEQPERAFSYVRTADSRQAVAARTPVSLEYLRLLYEEPDIKLLWVEGQPPDLAGLARRELLNPLSRRQARGWFATRLLQAWMGGGEAALRARGAELKELYRQLEACSFLQQGARDLMLAGFQMLDVHAKGKVANDIYDWLLTEKGVDWSL